MDIKKELINLGHDIQGLEEDVRDFTMEENTHRKEINDIALRIQKLAKNAKIDIPLHFPLQDVTFEELNILLDQSLAVDEKISKFPKLSNTDMIISCTAGIVAVIIDVFLVGTPETVKIYKGGENFDGSILTKAIRKLGEGPLGDLCKKLEKICKVPYDISIVKDGMNPNNHRLKSLAHDPFFGLFFAVFDIIMNTTTFIDNDGCLRILPNSSHKSSPIKKILCVFYYIGHIVSDIFTARGIPIPGFFLTQFFTGDGDGNSIAKIAEGMYRDGYDLRHFASMSTPVVVKSIIINLYLRLSEEAEPITFMPLAEREKLELNKMLRKEKMHFIANSIAVGGNVAKFLAPPYSCNPNSLNAPEWLAFIKSGIIMLRAQFRDIAPEQALKNRGDIDAGWDKLLQRPSMDFPCIMYKPVALRIGRSCMCMY